jgi:hypothetical protein
LRCVAVHRDFREVLRPNKLTGDVKAAIVAAFDEAGGKDYLVKLAESDPRTFCALVGKVVPMAVGGDPENPLQLAGRIKVEFVGPDSASIPPAKAGLHERGSLI